MRRLLSALTCILLLQLSSFNVALSQPAQTSTASFDLSSEAPSLSAAELLEGQGAVPIRVGNQIMQVSSGTTLTPAQYVAVSQMLNSGRQQIVVNAAGSATGGSVVLSGDLSQQINALTVPKGVTVVRDFAVSGNLGMNGAFVNNGTFYALSTSAATDTAIISAATATNATGALISSILPAGGIAGFTSSLYGLNLVLHTVGDIHNSGRIESDGNISLVSGSGSITNAGRIESFHGNIAFDTASGADLVINNTGGMLKAAEGNINIRTIGLSEKVNTWLTGGDIMARETNVSSGGGKRGNQYNQHHGAAQCDRRADARHRGDRHARTRKHRPVGRSHILQR